MIQFLAFLRTPPSELLVEDCKIRDARRCLRCQKKCGLICAFIWGYFALIKTLVFYVGRCYYKRFQWIPQKLSLGMVVQKPHHFYCVFTIEWIVQYNSYFFLLQELVFNRKFCLDFKAKQGEKFDELWQMSQVLHGNCVQIHFQMALGAILSQEIFAIFRSACSASKSKLTIGNTNKNPSDS